MSAIYQFIKVSMRSDDNITSAKKEPRVILFAQNGALWITVEIFANLNHK